jgi:hypothetical protein
MTDLFTIQNQHHRVAPGDLPVSLREVRRYLGYYRVEPDERVNALIDDCIREALAVITPQGIYSVFEIKRTSATDTLDLTFAQVTSRDLSRNLAECHHCILFAATIGPKMDQLIMRASRLDPLKGCILQAVGAMLVESYCDLLNDQLLQDFKAAGYALRPRFSPGYGDFSLKHQQDIFRSIWADKTIGLTLMDSGIMAPEKSVTAVIGVYDPSANHTPDYLPGCDRCETCSKSFN